MSGLYGIESCASILILTDNLKIIIIRIGFHPRFLRIQRIAVNLHGCRDSRVSINFGFRFYHLFCSSFVPRPWHFILNQNLANLIIYTYLRLLKSNAGIVPSKISTTQFFISSSSIAPAEYVILYVFLFI